MSAPTVPPLLEDSALFLDVDGTLLEIAETPQSVCVPESLKTLLIGLSTRLDGALALISGRSLEDLDRLFSPLLLAASGQHGSERRDAFGCMGRSAVEVDALDDVRVQLTAFVKTDPALLLEDKGSSLAVHFRRRPELESTVFRIMSAACAQLGSKFRLQPGKCVYEIRPAARSKGTAIATFMTERPFYGRKPYFLGDDVTDEEGFEVVNTLDGVSVKVGESAPTMARYRLRGVSEVFHWLGASAAVRTP